MPRMKNVNVYVDVDLTLIDHRGVMLPNAVAGVISLHAAGCHLFLWSTGGSDYCKSIAERLQIAHLFEAFLPKPDIYVDDMPGTIFNGLLFDVQDGGWNDVVEAIKQHIHPAEKRNAF